MERFILIISSVLFTITWVLLIFITVNQSGPTYVAKSYTKIEETTLQHKTFEPFIPLVDARMQQKEEEEDLEADVENEIQERGRSLEDYPIYDLPNDDDGVSIDDLLDMLDLETPTF